MIYSFTANLTSNPGHSNTIGESLKNDKNHVNLRNMVK